MMMIMMIWVVKPCRLVGQYQSSGEAICLFSPEDGDSYVSPKYICLGVNLMPQPKTATSSKHLLLKKYFISIWHFQDKDSPSEIKQAHK
jgi:hypothetical protein